MSIWTFSTRRMSVRPTGDDAGDDVAVAGQELRRRLDDEVGAELERAAHVGRGEGVVDEVRRAVLVGEAGEGRVVGHDGRRVGDGLGVHDPGRGGAMAVGRGRRVGQVGEHDLDAERARTCR